jgi:cytochrome c-type biogenesis protein CcmF
MPTFKPCSSKLINGNVNLVALNVGMGESPSTVTVAVRRGDRPASVPETLNVEASIKPYINLLWGGTVVMLLGFVLAILKRVKEA